MGKQLNSARERFEQGKLKEHEYYKIKGFFTVLEQVPLDMLDSLIHSSNTNVTISIMNRIAASYLMDSDDENK